MTDANTAALHDQMDRDDRSAERYSDAIDRVIARFYSDPGYFREQMLEYGPDELIDLIGRDPTDFWAARTDESVAISLIRSLINGVYSAHEGQAIENEAQRIE